MKHLFFVLLTSIAVSCFGQFGPSKSSPDYKNIIRTSVSQFTLSTFQLSYERFLKPTTSVYISPSFHFIDRTYEQSWGTRIEFQYRYYAFVNQREMSSARIYFAPYLYDQYMFEEYNIYDYSSSLENNISDYYNVMSVGILAGLSYSFAGRINADIYIGGGLRKASGVDDHTDTELFQPAFSGITPRLGFELGFWF